MDSVIGTIVGTDLTVSNADQVRDFYSRVVGWQAEGLDMGGYEDYFMQAPVTGQPVAGICHARGVNADLPAQWLIYIRVADLDQSLADCETLGGRVLVAPKPMGDTQRYAVIQDPAGAIAALLG